MGFEVYAKRRSRHAHARPAWCCDASVEPMSTTVPKAPVANHNVDQASAVKVDRGNSCAELGKESIRCIEQHDYNRAAPECAPHFLAYKECKKLMTLERRKPNKTLDML